MTLKEAKKILSEFQLWRRGAETEMISPKIIGVAIDVILKHLGNEK